MYNYVDKFNKMSTNDAKFYIKVALQKRNGEVNA